MKIGNSIREIREKKKWSQEYVAELMGMSVNGYGKIERNEVDINVEKLQQLAQVLDAKIEEFFKEGMSFNNYTGDNNTYFSTIYQQSTKIEKLYEEQIVLLKDKIEKLEAELAGYKK